MIFKRRPRPRSARSRALRPLVVCFTSAVLTPLLAFAQEAPTVRTILTGYAAVGYSTTIGADERRSDFTGLLSLVPLAWITEDVFMEAEVEAGLHGNETLIGLEHVEARYHGFERLQFVTGKFHLPVGLWMHTNWTNKMPTPPLLYEDTHGEAAANALIPIIFDLGAMATWTIPLLEGWRTSASLWVSQGPVGSSGGGHAHDGAEDEGDPESEADAPLLVYGSNYEDNNTDKMLGLALRAVSATGLTVQGTGFRAAYDPDGDLTVSALNLGIVWAPGSGPEPLFQLKGEGMVLVQEYLLDGAVEKVDYGGYYVQLSRRMSSPWEPVVRWSHLPRAVAGQGELIPRRKQLALGLNYWMTPSVPVKVAYHWEADRPDGLFVEWALGF